MPNIKVVIETPKGSAQKYDFDPQAHFFELSKILPSGMVFPYDFGFIPGTKGGKTIRNDRFLAIPKCSYIFQNVEAMHDLPRNIMDDLEGFFVNYNKLEGKKFKILSKMDPKEANRLILPKSKN